MRQTPFRVLGVSAVLTVAAALVPTADADGDQPGSTTGLHDAPKRLDERSTRRQQGPSPSDAAEAPDGEVLVRLDQDVRPEAWLSARERTEQRRAIDEEQSAVAREIRARNGEVRRTFDTVPLLSARVPPPRQEALVELDAVKAVVPNLHFERELDDSLPSVGATAPAVTDSGLTGEGQAVAVIDDGIQRDHEFFADDDGNSRVAAEACFLSDTTGRFDTCPDGTQHQEGEGAAEPLVGTGHGQHVSGIAAGADSSAADAPDRGVAPGANILAANVTDGDRRTTTDDIVAAFEWVHAQANQEVGGQLAAVNLSMGLGPMTAEECATHYEQVFEDVVTNLHEAGVLTVGATGNTGSRRFTSPLACSGDVVSVAATDHHDRLAGFSNVAHRTDLVAPGTDVRSAGLYGSYFTASGTSMSAPMVTGAAAVLREADPDASADELLTALRTSPVTVDDDRSGGAVEELPRLGVPAALVEQGELGLSAATTSTVTPPGADIEVDTTDLVHPVTASDDLEIDVTQAPAALDVTANGDALDVTVPDDTSFGEYAVEWAATNADADATAEATLTLVVSPWQQREAPPVDRRDILRAATDADGRIYLVGGTVADAGQPGNVAASDRVDRYDPLADTWETLPGLAAERAGVATASDQQGRIYAIHSGEFVERFDPEVGQWETLEPLPSPRFELAAASDNEGRIYAIGGWDPATERSMATVERYDPDTESWETLASLDTPREALAATADDEGRIYAVAGYELTSFRSAALRSVERFDPDGTHGEWTEVASLNEGARYSHDATADGDGRIFTLGGTDAAGQGVEAAERYDPDDDTWTSVPAAPREDEHAALAATAGRVHAFGTLTQRFVTTLPGPGTLTGTLTDPDGDGVAGAEVTAIGPDEQTVTTDDAGDYAMDVAPGVYTVTADHADFNSATRHDVAVRSDDTEVIDFTLTPALESLSVEPAEMDLAPGDEQPMTAVAVHADGSEEDVTADASWSSDDPQVATVDDGLVTAEEAGTAEITAEVDGRTAAATVSVDVDAELQRIAGSTRFETAARLSAESIAPGVERAYVATGTEFADALTGGVAAAVDDAPVLLVTHDEVPGETADELDRLDPDEIVILGGTEAVSDTVADELAAFTVGPVERLAGPERFTTAAEVARHAFPDTAATVYVSTGVDFPDALAGVPAAAHAPGPLLLATADTVPAATADELDRLDPDRVVVLGGEAAIAPEVEAELSQWATVDRVAGDGRFATAADVARELGQADAVYAATGHAFADALTAGAIAGSQNAPVLLVTPETLPQPSEARLQTIAPTRIVVLGGTGAVGPEVEDRLSDHLDG